LIGKDGWIVTSGYKTGVVQLVGEAIHDHKVTNPSSHITAIGCSKWGATRNRESLIIVNILKLIFMKLEFLCLIEKIVSEPSS
jgi:hypothetical protein